MTDRCTGHCCQAFCLRYSLEELGSTNDLYRDQEVIADMVIPLFWVPVDSEWRDGDKDYYTYTCRHLQPNGDCSIYDSRPGICRDYPNGEPCPIPACTLKNRGVIEPEQSP